MSAPNAHGHDAARFGPGAVIRRSSGMSNTVIRRYNDGHGGGDSELSGIDLDELVERVADKLEQRVIEELERRGRRNFPEVF